MYSLILARMKLIICESIIYMRLPFTELKEIDVANVDRIICNVIV